MLQRGPKMFIYMFDFLHNNEYIFFVIMTKVFFIILYAFFKKMFIIVKYFYNLKLS